MASGTSSTTAAEADGLAKPPLLILDRVRGVSRRARARRGRAFARGGSARAAARTSRSCSSATRASSSSDARRGRRCRRPRTTSSARRGSSSRSARPASSGSRRSLAVCEDESVLGVPFYVMADLDGLRPDGRAPAGPRERGRAPRARRRPRGRARRDPRCRRDDSRARGVRATRELQRAPGPPLRSALGDQQDARDPESRRRSAHWLADNVPEPLPPTVVHGDFRLGNTMVAPDEPSRILAVLDWEMGAIGDPRADVGYLLATYSEPGGPPNPLGTSPVTALPGFPSRAELVERYVARSGRDVEPLAVVRGARAVEGGRLLRGDLRPLRSRRARRRGCARRPLRAGRPVPRGGGRGRTVALIGLSCAAAKRPLGLGDGSRRIPPAR